MTPSVRLLLTATAFLAVYVFCWIALLFFPLGNLAWLSNIAALVVAIVVARRTWIRTATGGITPMMAAGFGAAIVGSFGFAVGFLGPIIVAPEANQGPLLGIFITGPLGAVVGAVGGYLIGIKRTQS